MFFDTPYSELPKRA
jgi:hypothetical protein